MAVHIRLHPRRGHQAPSYRVVAIDSRRPRDGRSLEILGFYDPLTEPATVKLDAERLDAWIAKGAKPSDSGRAADAPGRAWPAHRRLRSARRPRPPEAAAQGQGHQGIGQGREAARCAGRSRGGD